MSGIVKRKYNMTNRNKKARMNKKAAASNPLRQISMGIHYFKRTWSTNEVLTDVFTNKALDISLDQVPNYTEFTNLFDEYKICGIKMKIMYSHNSSDINNTVTRAMPLIMIVRDYDDATPLTNYNEYNQYSTLKVKSLEKPISMYGQPKCSSALYTGTVFTGYGSMKNQWIDCSSATVKHYAFKWGIDPVIAGTGTNNIGRIMTYTTLYFKCRGTR